MMKRIVVGVDATPAMEPVLRWVERFATDVGVRVEVVHVVPRTLLLGVSSMQLDSNAYLKNLRSQLERDVASHLGNAGISARSHVVRGDPARELARFAQTIDADLVVIGGVDHGALHDALIGGLAHRLERRTDTPVVVVPLKPVHANDSR